MTSCIVGGYLQIQTDCSNSILVNSYSYPNSHSQYCSFSQGHSRTIPGRLKAGNYINHIENGVQFFTILIFGGGENACFSMKVTFHKLPKFDLDIAKNSHVSEKFRPCSFFWSDCSASLSSGSLRRKFWLSISSTENFFRPPVFQSALTRSWRKEY